LSVRRKPPKKNCAAHPRKPWAASLLQTLQRLAGVPEMTKMISFAAAFTLFALAAVAVLMQAAQIVA
jgi:hypothetical protein